MSTLSKLSLAIVGASAATVNAHADEAAGVKGFLPVPGKTWTRSFFCGVAEEPVYGGWKNKEQPMSFTIACENPKDTICRILYAGHGVSK